MSIERIDAELCIGCSICVGTCPVYVIRMDSKTGRPVIRYPEDCMCCYYCELECPEQAIYVAPEKSAPLMVSWR